MTSIERRRETALAKVRPEEIERQTEAKRSIKVCEFNVFLEESHQKLAEAIIEEADYLEDASEINGLRRRRSKLAMIV